MTNIQTIKSIDEYTKTVSYLNNKCECSCVHDEVLLFRGQADKSYELLPSIGRNRRMAFEERNLIEMAKFGLPDVFCDNSNPIELLALLQHHGIPTRLLDVTESALVALYFACCNGQDTNGEIIVFKCDNNDVTNYPVVNAIADSFRFARNTIMPLAHFYAAVKSQPYFLEQQETNRICHNTDVEGGKWIAECCETPFYIYAPNRSLRQQVQRGRYILFPNEIKGTDTSPYFTPNIEPLSKEHKDIVARVIIPKEIKKQLLKDLSVLGITESFLFCDNVDTVCKGIVDSIKRRY